MHNRFYSPKLARFMGPDRVAGNVSNPQSLNGYSYTLNDPSNLRDPSGFDACPAEDSGCLFAFLGGFLGGGFEGDLGDLSGGWGGGVNPAVLAGWTYSSRYGWGMLSPAQGTDLFVYAVAGAASRAGAFSPPSSDDPQVGMNIFTNNPQCPTCGDLWQHTSAAMNQITGAYAVIYGGGFLGASAAPYAASLAATGVGWAYGLTGGSGVVLGAYEAFPNYLDAAESTGANALNMGRPIWNMLNAMGETWTANQAFLDASVFRGQQIWLSTNALAAQGSYYLELQYLTSRGVGPDQWLVVPLPY
jgi:hypothetical protein